MSDGGGHAHRDIVATRERAQARYGHLSQSDAEGLHEHHVEQERALDARIRVLEKQRDEHCYAADALLTMLLERSRAR